MNPGVHSYFTQQQLIYRRLLIWVWRRTVPRRLARELQIWRKLLVQTTWTLSASPIPKPCCWQLSFENTLAPRSELRYANLSSTASIPYMTHKLSSLPRLLALSRSSRCMAAQKCQILPCSMLALFSGCFVNQRRTLLPEICI